MKEYIVGLVIKNVTESTDGTEILIEFEGSELGLTFKKKGFDIDIIESSLDEVTS